jgi:hypothetical protein
MKGAVSEAIGNIGPELSGSKASNVVFDSSTPEAASILGSESTVSVAVTFGRSGGKGVFRVEIRDSKSLDVNFVVGSVSLSKTRRLAAIGYEDGAIVGEGLGFRGKKKLAKGSQ